VQTYVRRLDAPFAAARVEQMTDSISTTRRVLLCALGLGTPFKVFSWSAASPAARPKRSSAKPARLARLRGTRPRNIVLILSDDHRYDAIGFMKAQSFLQTPNLDRLAAEGVHFRNAFVTTSLCSPSRASILTGLYAHQHRVVDNDHPIDPRLIFFPQYLQGAGYDTAFIGKWHMGQGGDDPQQGFDHWVSFKGHGSYLPSADGLNVNGLRVPQKGYITDELTDYALEWLNGRRDDKPFMLYLSHKAVHSEFIPAERHRGRYAGAAFKYPATMRVPEGNPASLPMWAQNQRNSTHGVDFPYGTRTDIADYYRAYAETLLAVDESVGRIMEHLERRGILDSTLILYMGDNGFAFGEHGLIDKRTAYEESMRIPMLARCPELFSAGSVVEEVVANIDVAPTLLAAAGLQAPADMAGMNALGLARGEKTDWRDALLYEYYWERYYPQTPTTFAIRADRYKYIRYHGIWDVDELYDLQADPLETSNLIFRPGHEAMARTLNDRLFDLLEATHGTAIALKRDAVERAFFRRRDGAREAPFPPQFFRDAR
jgi:N-acetylglucosamine-6-sulfatase